jgi:Rha family phage regulatory protein
MNDLVVLHNEKPMVSSQIIAEKFGKVHAKLIRDIDNLHCSESFKGANFGKCSFKNKMGREFDGYMMTKDGFAFLCMGFTGKKAAEWKEKYIAAFNAMESQLARRDEGIEWKQARLQSKQARRSVTDTISDFVKYAEDQGSKSAVMYYSNITKMEYKALELIAKNENVSKGFRDTLDSMQLCFLSAAEQVAKAALKNGMDNGLHYKEIYIDAKLKVTAYASTVGFARLENDNR